MNRFLVTFLVIFLSLKGVLSQAQQLLPLDEENYFQLLHHNLSTADNDNIRSQSYLLLSEFWLLKDTRKSEEFITKVRSMLTHAPEFEGRLLYYTAQLYNHQGKKDAALNIYEKAIPLLEKSTETFDKKRLSETWYNMSYLQFQNKGYDFMVDIITNKCIPLAESLKDTQLVAYYNTQLGLIFMSVGQFDKADDFHQKSLELLKHIPAEETVHLITYHNMVSNYCYMPDSKTAKTYLDKANILLKKYPESIHKINYYYQEGMYFTTIGNNVKALVSLSKGVELAKEKNQTASLQLLEFRIYNNYLMQKNYAKAKAVLENILHDGILTQEVNNRKIVYTQLSQVEEILGNYKEGYQWLKKSSQLGDSIHQVKLLEKINELEILHETAEKQQTIDRLEQEKVQSALLNKNKNLRIYLLIIALILVLSVAVFIYINYQHQKKLNQQIHINHQQKINQLEYDRKFEAAQSILQGEEQERQRIAQDLHDSMGGMLTSIRMNLTKAESPDNEKEIVKKLDHAIIEMRRISRNLMPETLKNLGLETALKELCESMSHKNPKIQFECYNLSGSISFKTELALYRIVQECISNVLKHAQASIIIVQVSQIDNVLNLTVEDNGIGFKQDDIIYGLGIKNIEHRVQLINGKLEISAAPGEGTTINVECYV